MSAYFARMLEQYGCNVDGIWRAVVDAGKQVGLTLPPLTEEVVVEDKTFAIVKKLGEGGFSYVHLAREIPDLASEDYALKRILIHEEEHQGAIQNEIDVMRALDHPNILPLLYAEIEPHRSPPPGARVFVRKRASLVFPAYLDGTMFDRATTRPEADAFTSTQLMSIAAQLCDALECMHTLSPPLGPIAHRDVKLDNVLLESSPETEGGLKAVLMDFGSAKPAKVTVTDRSQALLIQEKAAGECTASYRAPELWDTPSECVIDERVDVWSLGCLLFAATAAGKTPFEYATDAAGGSLALAVMSGKYAWSEAARKAYPREVMAVAECCLEKDWRARPRARDVREKAREALATTRRKFLGGGGEGAGDDDEPAVLVTEEV